MNKKFLSAILFGALMVTSTGTFVSCKDYDDDIENLETQMATKSDVEAKLAQLQAALDAAKAESSANAADIAALEKEVASMLAKVEAAVEAEMGKYKAEIEALVKEVEDLVGKVADFVTSVELVYSHAIEDDANANVNFPRVLDFMTITEKENVFVKDATGAITFVKDKETQVAQSPLLVRVSPTNAVLSSDMISLVNSKGQNLDEYVDVKVSPYTDLLTRAANKNGLWKLTVTLKKKYDADTYAGLQLSDDKPILYAVQVNNALEAAEARYVTSAYDVTLGKTDDFVAADELDFNVTDAYAKTFNVTKINNRFTSPSNSLKESVLSTALYKELTWKADPAVAGTTDNTKEASDDRSKEAVIKAVQGQPITIAINDENAEIKGKVRAIYVTLDKANAVESAPSELNAWNSYKYEGLNKVVEATSTTITIDAASAINDYIGFRVYAVNYDGTLVDPDGRAFYVLVGDQAQEITSIATSITPMSDALVATKAVEVKALKDLGEYFFSWEMDDDDQVPFQLNFEVDNASYPIAYIQPGDKSSIVKINEILKISAKPLSAWYTYEDGKAYYGTLKAYKVVDGQEFVAATLSVSFTKNLPTLPEGFSFKDKQVIDGIYNCYMLATDWTAGVAPLANGYMPIENFINFGDGNPEQYYVTFGTSAKNADDELISVTVKGSEKITVATSYVDNVTEHASVVGYNFGKVSSVKVDGAYVDYKLTAAEFKTVYCCFYKPEIHTWGWITREQLGSTYTAKNDDGSYKEAMPYSTTLTYGTPVDNNGAATTTEALNQYVYGKNAIDGEFSQKLSEVYKSSLKVTEAKLISDATQKEDYFEVSTSLEFKPIKIDLGSNPKADVPSTLIITCEDYYGHEITIKLPMTVKPRQ